MSPTMFGRMIALAGVALLVGSAAARAQTDLFWNPPGGGGTNAPWDTTTVNWGATATAATTAWPNTGNERANFGNTTTAVATVTVAAPVNAYGINFLNYYSQYAFVSANAVGPGAYTISGTNAITLTGPGGVIDVANVISNATTGALISAPIAGSVGLTKNDVGVLILSGADTYTGATQINRGALAANSVGALGATSGVTVATGAALQVGATPTNAVPVTLNGFGSTTSASGTATGGAMRSTAAATWAGVITLGSDSRINSDSNTLTISTGGITATNAGTNLTIGGGGGVTVTGVIGTNVGQLTKDGAGTLTLSGANTYTGATVVNQSKLVGAAQTTGGASPFSSGPVSLSMSSMTLNGVASTTTTTSVGDLTVAASGANGSGSSNLVVSNVTAGFTTSFVSSNLVRGGTGSTLVITPGATNSALGSTATVFFGNGSTLQAGTGSNILPGWVVTTPNPTTVTGDFTAYGGSGVTVATYSSTDITTSNNTSSVNQSTAATLAGSAFAYALKTNAAINLSGNKLTLGNGSGTSGLILNSGANVNGGTIMFGPTDGVVYAQGTVTLGAVSDSISSNGLSITLGGASTLTLNGNIVDNSGPSRLSITAATSNTSITISG